MALVALTLLVPQRRRPHLAQNAAQVDAATQRFQPSAGENAAVRPASVTVAVAVKTSVGGYVLKVAAGLMEHWLQLANGIDQKRLALVWQLLRAMRFEDGEKHGVMQVVGRFAEGSETFFF
jgi:hypothetical protein